MEIPELLCIGFLCHDLYEGKHILGGTASYSSIMASHLGLSTAVLTSLGNDFEFHSLFSDRQISIEVIASEKTTVFENKYAQGIRTQVLHSRATTLELMHLPENWKNVPIVKFCLIADEVHQSFLDFFPDALVAATIQGWLRQWDENGKVTSKEMDWELLAPLDIVFMSEDDIAGYEYAIPQIADLVEFLVMTRGKSGAVVYHEGNQFHFPAYPTNEIDPTGAGDIFAASFLYQFYKHRDLKLATAFAHASASCVVEKVGVHIPNIDEIHSRYKWYLKNMA